MNMREIEAQAKALAPILNGFIAKAVAELRGELGRRIDDLAAALRREIPAAPDLDDIARRSAELVPKPADGRDGQNGSDGKDGRDGVDGDPGDPGQNGSDGRDGVDGKSVTVDDVQPVMEAALSRWALEFERRAQDTLQRAVDRLPVPANGKDGRDGTDGLGFDDLSVEYDGERGLVLRFQRGDQVKEHAMVLPVPIDRGVYRPDGKYERGDTVTFGGSTWIAQKDEPADKPGGGDGWRLAVKKGRDGRDGAPGEKGDRGEKGMPGLDGKNYQ